MKSKLKTELRYPTQLIIALTWLCIGIAWLFLQPVTWQTGLLEGLFIIGASLMIVDGSTKGHQFFKRLWQKFCGKCH